MYPTKTLDGSQTLFSERYGQTFHSDKGALSESKHIFLAASGVRKRLRQAIYTSVLEIGFGTGLNFFLTADLALRSGAALDYSAVEQDVLPADLVQTLHYSEYLEHSDLLVAYLVFRDEMPSKVPPGTYPFKFEGVGLELRVGDATEQSFQEARFDAIYQDAFSPDANPELWTEAFFTKLKATLKPGGVMTTYSVKGDVRRRLKALGLEVEKRPGPPGGKREMLRARKAGVGG